MKKKKNNNNKNKIITVCIISAVAAVVFFIAVAVFFSEPAEDIFKDINISEATQNVTDKSENGSETTENTTKEAGAEKTTESVPESTRINKETGRIIVKPEQKLWNLVVVNMGREMPSGYKPELDEILSTGIYKIGRAHV